MNVTTKPNDFAFPTESQQGGLTIREHFASLAMQGFITTIKERYLVNGGYVDYDSISDDSVRMADALIERLNKPIIK